MASPGVRGWSSDLSGKQEHQHDELEDTTGSFTGPPEEPISVRRVSFHRPSNGTTAYAHTAKVYAGGRDITEGEALATARAALPSQGLDEANLIMKVTTDVALAARVQRLDLETNALVDEPTLA